MDKAQSASMTHLHSKGDYTILDFTTKGTNDPQKDARELQPVTSSMEHLEVRVAIDNDKAIMSRSKSQSSEGINRPDSRSPVPFLPLVDVPPIDADITPAPPGVDNPTYMSVNKADSSKDLTLPADGTVGLADDAITKMPNEKGEDNAAFAQSTDTLKSNKMSSLSSLFSKPKHPADPVPPGPKPVTKAEKRRKQVFWFLACLTVLFLAALIGGLSGRNMKTYTRKKPNAQRAPQLEAPPMGMSSQYMYGCNHTNIETAIKNMADTVSTDLADSGYKYILLSDCWQSRRGPTGKLLSKIPGGIKTLVDYVHSKGLKFGLHLGAGTLTCNRRPGSYGHQTSDAETIASWGVDYIEADTCYLPPGQTADNVQPSLGDALLASGRSIAYSVMSDAPNVQSFADVRQLGNGIGNDYDQMMSMVDKIFRANLNSRPGIWNDLGLLEVGNGMGLAEDSTHFLLWCALKSSLIIGNRQQLTKQNLDFLRNKKALAVNQDPLGQPVRLMVSHFSPGSIARYGVVTGDYCSQANESNNYLWSYNNMTKLLMHNSGRCLTVDMRLKWRWYTYLQTCDINNYNQKWHVDWSGGHINLLHPPGKFVLSTAFCKARNEGTPAKVTSTCLEQLEFLLHRDNEHFRIKNTFTNRCLTVGGSPDLQIYSGVLSDDKMVAVVVNRDVVANQITVDWNSLPNIADRKVSYDIVNVMNDSVTITSIPFTTNIGPHAAKMFIFTPK